MEKHHCQLLEDLGAFHLHHPLLKGKDEFHCQLDFKVETHC
uniref:Uncharacterized protein n=1 Tax=Arundo donax TaxID=35708 RepID=A0A0A8YDP9_ARUDO